MKILIAHSFWKHSAARLAEWLIVNGHSVDIVDCRRGEDTNKAYDVVFNAGVSYKEYRGRLLTINRAEFVEACVDKLKTFKALKQAGIPIPKVAVRWRDVPEDWDGYVVRTKVDGRRNEGTSFHNSYDTIPKDGVMYTEWMDLPYEYRIVVFKGEVVGRYYKRLQRDHTWELVSQPSKGFEQMDADAIRAAKALSMDYVGFDVIAKNKKSYAFLEGNSAATLQDEVAESITVFINNLE